MSKKSWYLIAYDVRDPGRLRRVHRYLKKQSLAAQRSVFIVYATQRRLQSMLKTISRIIKKDQDDVRAYPISHPSQLWFSGVMQLNKPLISAAPSGDAKPSQWRQLLNQVRKRIRGG